MQSLLTREQQDLLRDERTLLNNARVLLARVDATEEDQELLRRALEQLEELFLLVVVGEFNAGKTAFLNALLGGKHLPEGVTPTTAHIHILRYGESLRHETGEDELVTVFLPVEWLQEINLVDTPGTNAVIQRHQEITEHFVPQSDLVLFVTSADRPFSESERQFLQRIRQWGKKVVIVLNKFDLLTDPADQQTVLAFVRDNARQLLGVEPEVFPVSARLAQQAKNEAAARANGSVATPHGQTWETSNFGALEAYILRQLDAKARLRLKLENPLGVSGRLLERYAGVLADRQSLLKGDFETLDTVDEQLSAYEQDMRRDFQYQASRVDNILYAMAERGDKFFDEYMRIGRLFDLLNGQKVSNDFNREVVGETSREIERQVREMIDWMVDKDLRQWRAVTDYLHKRWSEHADHIVGDVRNDFELNRQSLLESVGREAQKVIDGYDRDVEATQLALEIQKSIVQTAAVEAGAVGLGAILVAVLHTTLLDITGVIGAGVLATFGFYILPYRRNQMKRELRDKINDLRAKLDTALNKEFEEELTGSVQRIRDAIAPYTRFVRIEREKLERLTSEVADTRKGVESLRRRIG